MKTTKAEKLSPGRPRGSRNPIMKVAENKEKTIRERVLKNVPSLIDAQLNLARGCSYLYKIEEQKINGKKTNKHILINNPRTIQKYLDGELTGDYYYITTEKPDNRAINSLLDRAFGRAAQGTINNNNFTLEITKYAEDTNTLQLPAEGLSARVSESSSEIQDSRVAPKIWEVQDSSQ